MKNTQLLLLLGVLGVGIFLGYLFTPRYAPMGMHRMMDGSMMSNNSGMDGMMESMMSGLYGKTGDEFDRAFLSEMIMHHEGAVDMAESALQDAKHQEIKNMAQAIISAQTTEINQMKAWQKSWYGN
jgi:uncharacterized protein (DUF305 family)